MMLAGSLKRISPLPGNAMRSSSGFCISINADYQPNHEGLHSRTMSDGKSGWKPASSMA
jgi:hypothetical protein